MQVKGIYGEFTGQPVEIGFLLLGESWGLNSGGQVWKQVSVPTELSCQPMIYVFNMVSDIGHIPFLCFI